MSEQRTPAPAVKTARPAAWRQIALGLAILLCGMVMGSAGTMVFTRRTLRHGMPPPDKTARSLADRMKTQLNLSPEQQQQVAQIMSRHLKQLRATRREQFRLMHDEVAAVLTPEQAAIWRKSFERFQRPGPERNRDHRVPRGPDGGGNKPGPRSSLGCPGDPPHGRGSDGLWF